MVAPTHDTSTVRAGETAAWLDALYSRCRPDDGEIVFAGKSKRQWVGHCDTGSGNLARAASQLAGRLDIYAKINLMDWDAIQARSERDGKGRWIVGTKNEVKTVVSFHLDCDAGKNDDYHSREKMLEILNLMPVPPSLIVNSDGDRGGFHSYWILKIPYRIKSDRERQYISQLTGRWQRHLNTLADGKLDATANIDRLLRIVGQPRSNGNSVTCHEYHPDRLYSLRELTLPAIKTETKKPAIRRVDRTVNETRRTCEPQTQPVSEYIDRFGLTVEDLLNQHGYTHLGAGEWLRPGSQSGGKSLKIASQLSRPGINVFSGADPHFDSAKKDGSVGRFHSIDQMFVTLRHDGDWRAAARWCHGQIDRQIYDNTHFSFTTQQGAIA
ncbi:hypothetical protein NHH03_16840 [Stieleria sp. TO1_6]|uniref:hypothetical protein n=1 Tax=Stieleria tagensis TaxID=2956795 RepID=UPI00209BB0C8|nr:hypothetical protein [Stieleria tagensis]MCO8123419.1 hypothetical protein [Stieleria tagensis]